jgi:hypothetical protein
MNVLSLKTDVYMRYRYLINKQKRNTLLYLASKRPVFQNLIRILGSEHWNTDPDPTPDPYPSLFGSGFQDVLGTLALVKENMSLRIQNQYRYRTWYRYKSWFILTFCLMMEGSGP